MKRCRELRMSHQLISIGDSRVCDNLDEMGMRHERLRAENILWRGCKCEDLRRRALWLAGQFKDDLNKCHTFPLKWCHVQIPPHVETFLKFQTMSVHLTANSMMKRRIKWHLELLCSSASHWHLFHCICWKLRWCFAVRLVRRLILDCSGKWYAVQCWAELCCAALRCAVLA